jgi:hypothetical protein
MGHSIYDPVDDRPAWNAGRKFGAKRPLQPKQVWAIRFWLDQERRLRDRALCDLAVDSKLRGCDLVKVRTGDLISSGRVRGRATVIQQKQVGLCSSNCWSPPAPAYRPGWNVVEERMMTSPSQVALALIATSVRASTLVWWTNGSLRLDCGVKITARTPCAAPKQRSSTDRPAISGLSKYFWATRRLKRRSGTWGLRWKTLSRSQKTRGLRLTWRTPQWL